MLKKKKISYISEESDTQTHKLKKRLKECQKQKEEYLTQAQQARADLINFRRRQEQFLEELKKYGQANFIRELLPVLDSLGIGSEKNEDLKQIQEQLEDILRKYNLKEIKTKGEKFNPEFHEAVGQVSAKGGSAYGGESGIIIQEVQKGYIIEDKVLRASKVKVTK